MNIKEFENEIKKIIKKYDERLKLYEYYEHNYEDDEGNVFSFVRLENVNLEDQYGDISFKKNDIENFEKEICEFTKLKSIPFSGIYNSKSAEFFINTANSNYEGEIPYIRFGAYKDDEIHDYLSYQIADTSEFLLSKNFLNYKTEADPDWFKDSVSLYINNLDKIINADINSHEFIEKLYNIVDSILFEISFLYSIDLKIKKYDYVGEYEDLEEEQNFYKLYELSKVNLFDSDLLKYYHRALDMNDSEFKYIAFFQVIECLFEEVYNEKILNGLRETISSIDFNLYDNDELKKVIEVVKNYKNNESERIKLKMVLGKYLINNMHDETFITSNKKMIKLMKELKIIKSDKDIKNYHNLADKIYDYRCECTHSSRNQKINRKYFENNESLNKWLELIKLIDQKIIFNYKISKL